MKRTFFAGLGAALLLSLAACGGSSGSGSGSGLSSSETKAADAISAKLMSAQKSASNNLVVVKKSEADCIGTGLVGKVGTANLQKYGLLTKDLKASKDLTGVKMSAADAGSAADVLVGCTDVKAMMQKAMASQMSGLNAKTKQCFNKVLNEKNLREVFVEAFQGNTSAAGKQLVAPLTKCATAGLG